MSAAVKVHAWSRAEADDAAARARLDAMERLIVTFRVVPS